MRPHKGMRPHDIIVLLKLSHAEDKRQVNLAKSLHMSQSEVSDSLGRSMLSGLVDGSKQMVYKKNLLEFLEFGLKYVFPAIPGRIQRGVPTGHSAPPLKDKIIANIDFVWPYTKGEISGESIEPLHKNQHLAALEDPLLHQKMALMDAIRLRTPRESKLAMEYLQNFLMNDYPS